MSALVILSCYNDTKHIMWVHVIGVSVEIELKLNWPGFKLVKYFKILHLIGQ